MNKPAVTDPSRGNRRNTKRLPLVLLMAGSLIAASVWRGVVLNNKSFGQRNDAFAASGAASVGQFNSYTLGLLLGGLRGPLVMTLWASSEAQKGEKNLEDINTKIELIRLLQPEFDAVHLFQIWNKAYNLSVQMSNLASKYATILDALSYADSARKDKANINLESAVASIYFDKLGSASEKAYYRQRVRDESRAASGQSEIVFPASRRTEFVKLALDAGADPRRYTIRPESGATGRLSVRLRDEYAKPILAVFTGPDITVTHIEPHASGARLHTSLRGSMDPLLDESGKLLPSVADRDRPADVPDVDWRPEDGELGYLRSFEPYPYGVSPFALAYNYYKRSVALQESRHQKHAQLSERVISSRPALSLKAWAEEEIELGRLAEMAQFGLVPMSEDTSPLPLEQPATVIPIDPIAATPLLKEAIYDYDHAATIGSRSIGEFSEHTTRYRDDFATYTAQLADVAAKTELARGDAAFLKTITTADPAARATLAADSAAHYHKAIELMDRNILAYYVPEPIMAATFPKNYGKLDVVNSFENPSSFPAEFVEPTTHSAIAAMLKSNQPPVSEVNEYLTYVARAQVRIDRLTPLLKQSGPATTGSVSSPPTP